jgi:hypothetical protein
MKKTGIRGSKSLLMAAKNELSEAGFFYHGDKSWGEEGPEVYILIYSEESGRKCFIICNYIRDIAKEYYNLPQEWGKFIEFIKSTKFGKFAESIKSIKQFSEKDKFKDVKWLVGPDIPYGYGCYNYRPATEEEIKNHLIKEFNKKGIIPGMRVKSCIGSSEYLLPDKFCFTYNPSVDCLFAKDEHGDEYYLYRDGKWVEPVKEELPSIFGYKGCLDKNTITYGCLSITIDELRNIREMMDKFNIVSLRINPGREAKIETIFDWQIDHILKSCK